MQIVAYAEGEVEDKFTDYFDSVDQFSGSVLVAKNAEILYCKAFGFANVEHNVTNLPETRFRIGSLTKQFTAMGIMILVERGEIVLEDGIAKYLDSIPAGWQDITIRQLLTHTSGLIHSWEADEFTKSTCLHMSTDEVIRLFWEKPLLFGPGEDFHYSGLGYFILARIIENIGETHYASFILENILKPLEMKNSGMDTPGKLISNRAAGYIIQEAKCQNAPYINMQILKGGGNMYSTIGDLFLWDRGLREHRLISSQSSETLFKPVMNNYAFGWRVVGIGKYVVAKHNGSVNGFFAQIFRLLDQDIVVVLLMNQNRHDHPKIGNRFFQLVLKTLANE